MPEPTEEGSLDEALKARAPSLLCSAPGESLDTAKELSIKFDAKEDAEITQADAAGRKCRRQGEVPRSLPLKTSSWNLCLKMCLLMLLSQFKCQMPKVVLFGCFVVVGSLICCQLRMCCAESQ